MRSPVGAGWAVTITARRTARRRFKATVTDATWEYADVAAAPGALAQWTAWAPPRRLAAYMASSARCTSRTPLVASAGASA